MTANQSSHLRIWLIGIAIFIVLAIGTTVFIWQQSRSDDDVSAQREALRQASDARLRIKTFMAAAQSGNITKMTRMLHADPALIHAKDSDGASVLHQAAANNQTAAVALLLDHGAPINQKGPYGPPLEWAVYDGAESAVKLLLQRHAKPDADMLINAERGARGEIHSSGHIPHQQYARIASLLEKAGVKPDAPIIFISLLNNPDLPLPTDTIPIDGQWSPAVLKKMTAAGNLLDSVFALGADPHRTSAGITLHDSHEYTGLLTNNIYYSPLQIDINAMTDGTDLHIYYGPSEVIFNYGYVLTQLSVLDPVLGHYARIPNQGNIPTKKFVKIVLNFNAADMEIFADGQLRYRHAGDYAHLRGRVGIGPALRSVITVESINISSLPYGSNQEKNQHAR